MPAMQRLQAEEGPPQAALHQASQLRAKARSHFQRRKPDFNFCGSLRSGRRWRRKPSRMFELQRQVRQSPPAGQAPVERPLLLQRSHLSVLQGSLSAKIHRSPESRDCQAYGSGKVGSLHETEILFYIVKCASHISSSNKDLELRNVALNKNTKTFKLLKKQLPKNYC
jgi:hypothetical protein